MFVYISIHMHTGDTNHSQSSTLQNKHEKQTSYVYFQGANTQRNRSPAAMTRGLVETLNTLQHTGTRWNTLQQTATHCYTLQNAMQGKGSHVDE